MYHYCNFLAFSSSLTLLAISSISSPEVGDDNFSPLEVTSVSVFSAYP